MRLGKSIRAFARRVLVPGSTVPAPENAERNARKREPQPEPPSGGAREERRCRWTREDVSVALDGAPVPSLYFP